MLDPEQSITGYRRFNRYMVECEYLICFSFSISSPVLIDTWWNVNDGNVICMFLLISVLIDTWWNVNVLLLFNSLHVCAF